MGNYSSGIGIDTELVALIVGVIGLCAGLMFLEGWIYQAIWNFFWSPAIDFWTAFWFSNFNMPIWAGGFLGFKFRGSHR